MDPVPVVALAVSVVALIVSLVSVARQLRLSRQANSLPVLVDMFKEHRSRRLRRARAVLSDDFKNRYDLSKGLQSLPQRERDLVIDLSFYYDNLGALVAYRIVDLPPIAGYLGGSVVSAYENLSELIAAERAIRSRPGSPSHWQAYFKNLYLLVKDRDLAKDRARLKDWRALD